MNACRLLHPVKFPQNTLDLIYHDLLFCMNQSVGTSFYFQSKPITDDLCLKRYLRLIIRSHLSLDLPVDPASHLHILRIWSASCSIVNIPFS